MPSCAERACVSPLFNNADAARKKKRLPLARESAEPFTLPRAVANPQGVIFYHTPEGNAPGTSRSVSTSKAAAKCFVAAGADADGSAAQPAKTQPRPVGAVGSKLAASFRPNKASAGAAKTLRRMR